MAAWYNLIKEAKLKIKNKWIELSVQILSVQYSSLISLNAIKGKKTSEEEVDFKELRTVSCD